MKKTAIIIAGAALLALGSIAVAGSISRNTDNTIFEANVEALADGEQYIELCNKYCTDYSNYICTLYTDYGFNISCQAMRPI